MHVKLASSIALCCFCNRWISDAWQSDSKWDQNPSFLNSIELEICVVVAVCEQVLKIGLKEMHSWARNKSFFFFHPTFVCSFPSYFLTSSCSVGCKAACYPAVSWSMLGYFFVLSDLLQYMIGLLVKRWCFFWFDVLSSTVLTHKMLIQIMELCFFFC